MRPEIYAGLEQGQVVTARVTPRLGYVHSIVARRSVKPRVFVTRRVPERVREELERSFAVDSTTRSCRRRVRSCSRASAGCDGLVTMLTDRVDAELLDAAGPQLRIVANYAVGLDNVDLDECERRGIVVSNTPDVLTDATAEMTIALMLALTRRVVEGDRFLRRQEPWQWAPTFMLGRGLAGLTLGIVGYGRIGQAVARLAEAHGMRVVHSMPLDELLAAADVVSLHVPLTERHASPDRRARARADEADRLPRQHEPRAGRGRGRARAGARGGPHRRRRARRLRARARGRGAAARGSRTSSSSPTSPPRPTRPGRRWACSA